MIIAKWALGEGRYTGGFGMKKRETSYTPRSKNEGHAVRQSMGLLRVGHNLVTEQQQQQ